MKWHKVGKYGMQSGEYRVAKLWLDGCTLYVLWYGETLIKHCESFEECQTLATSHAKTGK